MKILSAIQSKGNIFLYLLTFILLVHCEEEQKLVTYPESYPVFEKAEVVEPTIMYNDSVTLSVTLSDQGTPLSTMEVQVVLNNEVIETETVRTKGNSSEITRKYFIPFGPEAKDNEVLKVYLTSINVDGYTTDTIISTTTVQRPIVPQLYLVPETGTTSRMELIDTANMIFRATGMAHGSTLRYRLATKITKFGKVDWTGLVFGMKDGAINLIAASTLDDYIEVTDPTLLSITTLTFDAFNLTYTIAGKILEPVTTLDISTELSPLVMAGEDFLGGNIYFGKDVEVTFTGLTNLANSLPPDFFEITGETTARFLGNTAVYKAYYYVDGNYLYVEPLPDVVYPETMWVNGTGLGRPSTPYMTTTRWDWRSPVDYVPCRMISPGVYQFTAYMKNEPDGKGFGTLDFKFFHQRTWGGEEDASKYTVGEPLFGLSAEGKNGNVNGMTTSFEGVYRVTIDVNAKTITPVKLN